MAASEEGTASASASRGADVLAGLVTAAVVLPKAIAFATIAGLPIQVGLYTVFVPMAVYALLGTSRPLSVSSTTTIAILTAPLLEAAARAGNPADLAATAATLTVLVGVFLAMAAALRLGFVASFISEPVLTGFKSGIGVVIVVDQLPKLLGIHIEKAGFFRDLFSIASHLPETSPGALGLSLGVMALIVALQRFAPKVPAPLVAVAVGTAACALLELKVSTVGDVPRALPTLVLPRPSLAAELWAGAAGIALMSFTESIAAARAFAAPEEPRPRANLELLALGAANLAGGLLGTMPAGGGTSQTAVNRLAGARTKLAGLVTAAVGLLTLLFLAPMISILPNPVLAAIVVVYSVGLIKPKEFKELAGLRATELHWAVIAFVGVVLLGTLQGILVAVVASLLAIAHHTNNPHVWVLGRKRGTDVFRPRSDEHPDDETWPGLLLVRPEGRIFFSNAERVGEVINGLIEREKPSVVAIDCSAITDIEYTALKMLTTAEERLRRQGVTLWLAALNPDLLPVVRRSQLGQTLGNERTFFNLQTAVERYTTKGDPKP